MPIWRWYGGIAGCWNLGKGEFDYLYALMQGMFTIRLKAFFLSAIFTGNFLVVCRCSAGAVGSSDLVRMGAIHMHCCCRQKAMPCKDKKSCPGTQAVKFNLLEKKAAATVQVSPADGMVKLRYIVPAIEGRLVQVNTSFCPLPPYPPPDRLALYRCYLI